MNVPYPRKTRFEAPLSHAQAFRHPNGVRDTASGSEAKNPNPYPAITKAIEQIVAKKQAGQSTTDFEDQLLAFFGSVIRGLWNTIQESLRLSQNDFQLSGPIDDGIREVSAIQTYRDSVTITPLIKGGHS